MAYNKGGRFKRWIASVAIAFAIGGFAGYEIRAPTPSPVVVPPPAVHQVDLHEETITSIFMIPEVAGIVPHFFCEVFKPAGWGRVLVIPPATSTPTRAYVRGPVDATGKFVSRQSRAGPNEVRCPNRSEWIIKGEISRKIEGVTPNTWWAIPRK
jgi:hypothetical protein